MGIAMREQTETSVPPGEEALMAAYVAGDRDSFDALFKSLAPRVRGFFARWFGGSAVADDLSQTTFVKVHRARSAYRVGAPVGPWVFAIATRVGLDELRRRGRRREDQDELRLEKAIHTAALAMPDTPDLMERADLAARVRGVLKSLPESQRIVIDLHCYQGLTFGKIAGILGTTEGAVKLRAFRIYQRLRKQLPPLLEDIEGRTMVQLQVSGQRLRRSPGCSCPAGG